MCIMPLSLPQVSQMEAEGLIPVPTFINGVEAHTVVRLDELGGAAVDRAAQQMCSGVVNACVCACVCGTDACPCSPHRYGTC